MGTVPLKKGTVPISSINPNRGVGFSIGLKMLGLDCLWQTTLTVCRIIQHAHLKQHFLVCPVCAASQTKTDLAATPRVAGPAGCQPTASIKQSITPKRPGLATKLYLPLCTPQERNDARLAQLWIDTHTHPNRPLPPQAIQLIERYGELFETKQGRQLRCRQCLGLRYGEVKGKEK